MCLGSREAAAEPILRRALGDEIRMRAWRARLRMVCSEVQQIARWEKRYLCCLWAFVVFQRSADPLGL